MKSNRVTTRILLFLFSLINLINCSDFVGRTSFANSAVYNYQTASRYVYNLGTGATTSFTGSYNELRDNPTLVTASTDLSDSNTAKAAPWPILNPKFLLSNAEGFMPSFSC